MIQIKHLNQYIDVLDIIDESVRFLHPPSGMTQEVMVLLLVKWFVIKLRSLLTH